MPPYPANRPAAPIDVKSSDPLPIADDVWRDAGIATPVSNPGSDRYRAIDRPTMDRGAVYVAFCLFLWSLILLGTGFGIGLLVAD